MTPEQIVHLRTKGGDLAAYAPELGAELGTEVATEDRFTGAPVLTNSGVPPEMNADDFCYVATKGRVTGRPHEIEIWYARDGDTLYLLSGGGDASDWVRNIKASPHVTVRVDTEVHEAAGRIVTDREEISKARTLVYEKYQPRYSGSLDDWRESSLPVAIDLA